MDFVGRLLLGVAFLFAGFFCLNLFFRIKVLRNYRKLRDGGVEFAASAIFSPEEMEEIIARYPDYRQELTQFSKYIRYSVWMASVFIVTTILLGSILMYHR